MRSGGWQTGGIFLSNASKLGCIVLAILSIAAPVFAQGTSGSTSGGSGSTSSTGTSGSTSGGSGSGSCTSPTQQISIHIPDETVPPGGVAQMKMLVTRPTPVSTGGPRVAVRSSIAVVGIQLFNPNGD